MHSSYGKPTINHSTTQLDNDTWLNFYFFLNSYFTIDLEGSSVILCSEVFFVI